MLNNIYVIFKFRITFLSILRPFITSAIQVRVLYLLEASTLKTLGLLAIPYWSYQLAFIKSQSKNPGKTSYLCTLTFSICFGSVVHRRFLTLSAKISTGLCFARNWAPTLLRLGFCTLASPVFGIAHMCRGFSCACRHSAIYRQ